MSITALRRWIAAYLAVTIGLITGTIILEGTASAKQGSSSATSASSPAPYQRADRKKMSQGPRPNAHSRPDFGEDDKLSQAWERKEISLDDYVRLSVERISKPDSLPAKLRSTGDMSESTGLALGYALSLADQASPETRAWLKQALSPRKQPPSSGSTSVAAWSECADSYAFLVYYFDCRQTIQTTPPINIYYNIDGVSYHEECHTGCRVYDDGVPATDLDGNQIPDAIDRMSTSTTTAFTQYRSWGFNMTGDDISIYIGVSTNNNPGITFPTGDVVDGGPVILLPPDPGDIGGNGWYTYLPRHELFHAFQYHYMSILHFTTAISAINWWMEATAEWAVHKVYLNTAPTALGAEAYARSLDAFLRHPQHAVNASDGLGGERQYGAFIVASYLTERTDQNFVLRTWQEIDDQWPIEAIAQVLEGYGKNLSNELFGFAVANYRLTVDSGTLSDFLGAGDGYADPDTVSRWRSIVAGMGSRPARAKEVSPQNLPWGGSFSWAPNDIGQWIFPGGSSYFEFTPPASGQGQLKIHVEAPDQSTGVEFRYLLVVWNSLSGRQPLRWARADAVGNDRVKDLSVSVTAGEVATLIVARTDVDVNATQPIGVAQPVTWQASLTSSTVTPPAGPNVALNTMWARHADRKGYANMCANWGGGDGTQSVVLPSGNRAWFFSDTFLGDSVFRPTFDRSMLHNSIVVQQGTNPATASLKTVTGGNTCKERDTSIPIEQRYAWTPIRSNTTGPDRSDEFYWSATGKVFGNNVVWFYLKGSGQAFRNTSIATIPLSSLENSSNVNVTPQDLPAFSYYGTDNPLVWGDAVIDAPDGFTYIYGWGVVDANFRKKPFLARVLQANLVDFNSWRFYVGGGKWSADGGATGQTKAVPLGTGYTDAMYSVVTLNGRHWIVTLDPTTHEVVAYPSTSRYGFTTARVKLYSLPDQIQKAPDFKIVYDLHLHEGLSSESDTVVVSYNVNSTGVTLGCRAENDYEPSIYRARFVNIPKRGFDPSAATTAVAPLEASGVVPTTAAYRSDDREMRGARYTPFPSKFAQDGIPPGQSAAVITQRNALQEDKGYYNSWAYQSDADKANNHVGCPYIAAPTDLAATVRDGAWGWVDLTWSHVGLDVGYKVYEYNVTEGARRHWPWDWNFGPPRLIAPLDDFPADRTDLFRWHLVPTNIWQQPEKTQSNSVQGRMPL
ncbi:hypothetical protein [Nonomuraea glycinis]|uniref:hypothetical protein n=1 Tax=Nonomuraea glycinis TaxID=2047744 RepID=UPI002E0F8AC6|nr:hypothetical protein OHA68_31465 [Nonomuraea glycinis]